MFLYVFTKGTKSLFSRHQGASTKRCVTCVWRIQYTWHGWALGGSEGKEEEKSKGGRERKKSNRKMGKRKYSRSSYGPLYRRVVFARAVDKGGASAYKLGKKG